MTAIMSTCQPPKSSKLGDRFWSKVAVRGPYECWLWRGAVVPGGYGRFRVGAELPLAHRLVLAESLGRELAPGTEALHGCDTPACVNPAHLREGRASENLCDRYMRGAAAGVALPDVLAAIDQRTAGLPIATSEMTLFAGVDGERLPTPIAFGFIREASPSEQWRTT